MTLLVPIPTVGFPLVANIATFPFHANTGHPFMYLEAANTPIYSTEGYERSMLLS